MAPLMNEPFNFTNCSYNKPMVTMESDLPMYAVPILGYLSPIVIFLTVISNSLVFIVFTKPDIRIRSLTNTILVAIALSDLFTGLFSLPIFLHFHATERFYEWVPYNWCYPYDIFRVYLPAIFHTASIWLTVAVAVQRYICFCYPFKARLWYKVRNAIYGTVVIYVIATLTHITRFFEAYYVETEVPSLLHRNQYVSACVFRSFLTSNINIFLWCRVIFVNVLPCLGLIVMSALLVHTVKVARRQRQELLGQLMDSERRKVERKDSNTLMIVAVACVFLLVEIPTAMHMIFYIIHVNSQITIKERDTILLWALFNNFCILLSYPTKFFIYYGMCKKFRDTFKDLFRICSFTPIGNKDCQNMAVFTEKSGSLVPVSILKVEEPV